VLYMDSTVNSPAWRHRTPAGTDQFTAPDRTIAQDGTVVSNTGSVTENTTRSKVIPANTIGQDGVLLIEWYVLGVAQGGVATTFRIKFGTTIFAIFTKAAVSTFAMRLLLLNRNATNSQDSIGYVHDSVAGISFVNQNGIEDTTADKTLLCTIQSGAAGDRWDDRLFKVHAVVGRTTPL